jgi:hypothetical protein
MSIPEAVRPSQVVIATGAAYITEEPATALHTASELALENLAQRVAELGGAEYLTEILSVQHEVALGEPTGEGTTRYRGLASVMVVAKWADAQGRNLRITGPGAGSADDGC